MKSVEDERLFNFRPCLFAAFFLCFGIVFAYLHIGYGLSVWWSLSLLPTLVLPYFLLRKKSAIVAGVGLALAFFVGFFIYGARASAFTQTSFYNASDVTVYGRVVESGVLDGEGYLVLDSVAFDGKEEKGKLVAYLPASFSKNTRCSDWVYLRGDLQTRTRLFGKGAVSAENFAEDIRFVLNAETDAYVAGHTFDIFSLIRETLKDRLKNGMTEDAAGVAFGILTGNVKGMDGKLLKNIRVGGIAHIFAVSGLHIGTLFAVCVFLLSKCQRLNGAKFLKFILVAAVIFFYGGVCGYSESVMRAVVTCLVGYASTLIGVKRDMAESLGLAALVVLIINPISLFCVGFQLSFAACLGIATLAKPLQIWFERSYRRTVLKNRPFDADAYPVGHLRGVRGKVFSFLSVTVSAQAATTPILLNAFGYLSAWGLLLNCLFVPLVGGLFSLTIGFSFLACLLPSFCSGVVLWIPNVVWTALLLVFEAVEFSMLFEGWRLDFSTLLSYYTLLLLCSDKLNLSQDYKFWLKLLFLFCFLLAFLARAYVYIIM